MILFFCKPCSMVELFLCLCVLLSWPAAFEIGACRAFGDAIKTSRLNQV